MGWVEQVLTSAQLVGEIRHTSRSMVTKGEDEMTAARVGVGNVNGVGAAVAHAETTLEEEGAGIGKCGQCVALSTRA